MKRFSRYAPQVAAAASGSLLLFFSGCGTATSDAYCKKADPSGYVAGETDIDGKAWEINMPKDFTIKCAGDGEGGTVKLSATIRDSQKIPKAGLAINASVGGASGSVSLNTKDSETTTDRCGMVFFYVDWTCPTNAGEQRAATIWVHSGSLSGSSIMTIDHYVPPSNLTD
jgi:hypothetical protein